jgi:hypothetical protein
VGDEDVGRCESVLAISVESVSALISVAFVCACVSWWHISTQLLLPGSLVAVRKRKERKSDGRWC